MRRLSTLLVGIWLAGGVFMWAISSFNLDVVDRLVTSPTAAAKARIEKLGPDDARSLLRHGANEQNRFLTEVWINTQIALGILLFLMLFFGSTTDLSALFVGFMLLALVLVERWFLIGEMTHLGRAIDFVAADEPSVERTRYWMFHTCYSGTEALKAALGAIIAFKLIYRKGRRGSSERGEREAA